MIDITPLIISSAVASIVSAIIACIISALKSGTKAQLDGQKALQQGMRELLWSELQAVYKQAKDDNGMTLTERRHLEHVYEAYHTLGGNGTGTRLYNEAMSLPVLVEAED